MLEFRTKKVFSFRLFKFQTVIQLKLVEIEFDYAPYGGGACDEYEVISWVRVSLPE